jgi:outer membrane scaffolding protein for murein synthesis (MipA/OmpV family)
LAFQTPALAADPYQQEPVPAAQDSSAEESHDGIRGKLKEWDVTLGAAVIYGPKFEGSDEFEALPVPFVSASFGDHVHVGVGGLRVDMYESNGFKFSVKGGAEFGRDEGDSDQLRGLGDVDTGAVIGGLAGYEVGPFEFTAAVDKTIGGSDGLIGTFGAKASHMYDQFLLSAGASVTWADDNHMDSYFSVNAAQSARTGGRLDVFDAEAGFKRVDMEVSAMYLLSENWTIMGQVGVGLLLEDAADSPIVQDEVQPSVMLGVGYKF